MVVNFIAEIRGCERKVSQKGISYDVYHLEDENGNAFNIMCRNLELVNLVKKGLVVNCSADLSISKYTKFELISLSVIDSSQEKNKQ